MSTAIYFASKHGTTEAVAREIAAKLGDDVAVIDLNKTVNPDIRPYENVIIGGSIHFGQIQQVVVDFCERNLKLLLGKQLGLFICCLLKEKEHEEFENAFTEMLRNHAKAKGFMGGELIYSRLSLKEKIITKLVSRTSKEVSAIDHAAIEAFIKSFTGLTVYQMEHQE